MSRTIFTVIYILTFLVLLTYFPGISFGQTKVSLNNKMMYNFSTRGDAGLLVDEQVIAGNPATGSGGTPTTVFSPGYLNFDIFYPAMVVIDLGKSHHLTSLWLFDTYDNDSIFIYTGDPASWEKKAGMLLNTYNTWREVILQDTSRFLMFKYRSAATRVSEIVLYGQSTGTGTPPPLPVPHPKPFIDHFLGVNGFLTDPVDKLSCVGNMREYHNWGWDEGNTDTTYAGFPNNQYAWNPSWASGPGWGFYFDDFYQLLKNNSLIVDPDLQGSAPYLIGFIDSLLQNKPLSQDENPIDPHSYIEHSDYIYQFAARYGQTPVTISSLKLKPNQPLMNGGGLVRYIENWNEPDKWWNSRKAYFTPDELSAMCSADYDGDENSMGTGKGMKAADPLGKMVMGGLASLNLEYLRCMKLWCDFNRTTGFPADVLNFHHYSGNGLHGISPEADNLKQKLKAIVNFRDTCLPGKEIWLSEFGYDTNPESEQAAVAIDTNDIYEVQGQWILRTYLEAIAAGLDKAFVFMLRDANAADPNKYNSSGLTTEFWTGHQPKKSWYYVYTMKIHLKGLRFQGEIPSGQDSVNVYKFLSGCGDSAVYAVWCTSSSNAIINNFTLNTGDASSARLIKPQFGLPAGNQSILGIQNHTVNFRVTERPVFVSTSQESPQKPLAAGSITGPATVQQGQENLVYHANPIANATGYLWTLPPGASITAGGNTNSISVSFASTAQSGNLYVAGTNQCGTGQSSPILEITVVPTQNNVTNVIVENGEQACFDAVQFVNVAGNGTTFLLNTGGSVTFIAGQIVLLLPGTKVYSGGNLTANITITGNYCPNVTAPVKNDGASPGEKSPVLLSQTGLFRIYPNPTKGSFTLEINPEVDLTPITLWINGIRGEVVMKEEMGAIRKKDFSLDKTQAGLYVIRLMMGDRVGLAKIIRL